MGKDTEKSIEYSKYRDSPDGCFNHQAIFLAGYAAYERSRLLPVYFRKAVWCIMNCRTAILGGKPGIIASLHTWPKTLLLHPHIHCLVTGEGGLKHGKWTTPANDNEENFPAQLTMAVADSVPSRQSPSEIDMNIKISHSIFYCLIFSFILVGGFYHNNIITVILSVAS